MSKIVNRFLKDLVAAFGFQQIRELSYARVLDDVTHLLTFGLRSDARGFFAMSCYVGLAFGNLPSIEEAGPHIVMPLHELKPKGNFEEWTFENELRLRTLESQIRAEIENLALPFFAEFSVVENVRHRLESKPDQWFSLTPEQRVNLLAAILHSQGQKEIALSMLDEELAKRANSLPKYRLPIERMRNRLLREG